MRAGAVPTFPEDALLQQSHSPETSSGAAADLPGATSNQSSTGGAAASAAARTSRDLQGFAGRPLDAHRSTMEGDSDEDEENEHSVLLGAQVSSLAVANAAGAAVRSSGGGLRPSGSRRSTKADVAATAAEAKAAEKADKKKPAWKLMQLLQASQEPLAVFLRETYEITVSSSKSLFPPA